MERYTPLGIIVCIAAVFTIFCGIYLFWATNSCPVESAPVKQPYLGEVHYTQDAKSKAGQHPRHNSHHDMDAGLPSLRLALESSAQNNTGASDADNEYQKHPGWFTRFLCDSKIGDLVLAYFTLLLALVTGWLVYATIGLQKVTADLAKHIPIVERAYVSGGGYFPWEDGRWGKGKSKRFMLTVDNYGKTPAYVRNVKIGYWCLDNGPLPDPPPEFFCTYPLGQVIPPGAEGSPAEVRIHRSDIKGDVIFGRFFYEDIFAKHVSHQKTTIRSSGFILKVNESRLVGPIEAPRAYTDWD